MKPEVRTIRYPNGKKWYEHHFVRGKRHGLCTCWHSNGKKSSEHHFVHGELHGLSTCWYPDGKNFELWPSFTGAHSAPPSAYDPRNGVMFIPTIEKGAVLP